MAEIRVEEKKNTWVWWVLGLIIVGAIIWYLVGRSDDDRNQGATTTPVNQTEQTTASAAAVNNDGNAYQQYSNWVNEGKMNMDKHHEATNEGILFLADALRYTADQEGISNEIDIKNELDKMRSMADEITNDWQATDHANKIRTAFNQAANVTGMIQKKTDGNLQNDVEELKRLANNVEPNTLTLNQKENIKTFFEKADDVLNKLNS